MRHVLVAALALLALAPACQADDPGEPDERPRGERCDEMQACGRSECAGEIQAVRDCADDDLGCGADPALWGPKEEALAACLEAQSCNTTTCDLAGAFTDEDPENAAMYCDSEEEAELMNLARLSLFTTDTIAECQALE